MEETINDRIEQLVNERFGGIKSALAKKIGLQSSGLSNYLGNERRSKPSVDMVVKIIKALNVDPMWLLTGEYTQSPTNHTEIDESPITVGDHNSVIVGDAVLMERIKSLQSLLYLPRAHE